MISMKELEQDPFDPEIFVEKLAKRAVAVTSSNSSDGNDIVDPNILHDTFLQAIKDLKLLQERQCHKCEKLEAQCREQEAAHWQEIASLQTRNKVAMGMFQELDERINYVATKVIHLGDQLESVNTPRARAVEAQKLMSHFADFLSPSTSLGEIFTDPFKVDEAADVIQKLDLIAQELPPAAKFDVARKKIAAKYDEIERSLIEEFVRTHRDGNVLRMKEIARTLSHFKGYAQCMDAFVEQSQERAFMVEKDVFRNAVPLCRRNKALIAEVFSNPDQVMAKFVLNIYQLRLNKHVQSRLGKLLEENQIDAYLKNLYELYSRTTQLSAELSEFDLGNDDQFLIRLTQSIYKSFLDTYMSKELQNLKESSVGTLQQFYDSKSHHKKPIQTSGLQELRRDWQAKISARTNINIAQIEDYGGETFLSEEVAAKLLRIGRDALQRCSVLSRPKDQPAHATLILDGIMNALLTEHVDYALDVALQALPLPESRTPPHLYFLDVARQVNSIVHLFERLFADSLMPLVVTTAKHEECLHKKRQYLEQMENKLDTGLDRTLAAIVGWVKTYLQTEQKKTDFRPETDVDVMPTQACRVVVQYITGAISRIRASLDGKNAEAVLMEFGERLHRTITDHMHQFTFNSTGAMIAIMDVNEYRKCAQAMRLPLMDALFDALHALANLLLVKPENLKQVCTGDTLAGLDRSILLNFIQLRSDYKAEKLALKV